RVGDLAVFHPVTGGAARIVAGDVVDAVAEQFGKEQAAPNARQQAVEVELAGLDDQVVTAAGIAGGLHAELAGRVGAQEIALQDAVGDDLAVAGGDAVAVEGGAAQSALDVRPFADLDEFGHHLLAEVVEQEGRLAVERAAAGGMDQAAEQPGGERRLEKHRELAGLDLAPAESGDGAFGGDAADAQ